MDKAGDIIDCTIGAQFGLSTLIDAAVRGLISILSGVLFGRMLETLAIAWGLPTSKYCFDLVHLLFIDTDKSSSLKLLDKTEEEEFPFTVEISNDARDDPTVLVATGPYLDGVLAGVTSALALNGCSLLAICLNHIVHVNKPFNLQYDKC
jgi:hypothetical protein